MILVQATQWDDDNDDVVDIICLDLKTTRKMTLEINEWEFHFPNIKYNVHADGATKALAHTLFPTHYSLPPYYLQSI